MFNFQMKWKSHITIQVITLIPSFVPIDLVLSQRKWVKCEKLEETDDNGYKVMTILNLDKKLIQLCLGKI